MIHRVEASLRPYEVGIEYKRAYQLDGDRLTLTTTVFEENGEQRFNRLQWTRMK